MGNIVSSEKVFVEELSYMQQFRFNKNHAVNEISRTYTLQKYSLVSGLTAVFVKSQLDTFSPSVQIILIFSSSSPRYYEKQTMLIHNLFTILFLE